MSSAWARLTIAALESGGVRELVICPGSRSAALADAAARSSLPTISVIDERSAAFYALGAARATGKPSAVICTSGTAGAHFYPAIIEASHASIPLIAITADRPPELQNCGASQTIDQKQLFGRFVRDFIDLGCAADDADSQQALLARLATAVASSLGPNPGPVHVNAPARKPLLASGVELVSGAATPHLEPRSVALSGEALARIAERVANVERAIVVVGPIPAFATEAHEAIAALAASTNAPVFAESSSQLRFAASSTATPIVDKFDALLRREGFEVDAPDAIIEFGAPPTSAGYARALAAHSDIWRVAIRPYVAADPARNADEVVCGDLGVVARKLASTMANVAPSFASAWLERNAAARMELASSLTAAPMSGQLAVRGIIDGVPSGGHVAIGNSLAIRWLDQVRQSEKSIAIHSQRGVAGIDGLIAGAVGSVAASGAPTALVLGDVSCAHDIGSLALARSCASPLAICVLDNSGGQIFSELPYAESLEPETLAGLFTTAPNIDFALAGASVGLETIRIDSADDVSSAVATAMARPRATLLWIRVAEKSPGVLGD